MIHVCFSWKAKLLVTPSKLVLLTGASLLGICVFIGLIILLLHLKEKVSRYYVEVRPSSICDSQHVSGE